MLIGAPIIIENRLKVDHPARLSICRQKEFTTHVDFRAHLKCRRNTSTRAQTLPIVRSWGPKDIRALDWCPSAVVLTLHFQLLIFHKQPKRIVPMWDTLQCDVCTLPKVSGMGQIGSEAPHDLDRGFDRLSATIMLPGRATAHRSSDLGRWVAMFA